MKRGWILLLSLLAACSHSPSRAPASSAPVDYALAKFKAKGGTEKFATLLKETYREDERLRVLDYNLLSFLRPKPVESEEIPSWELKRVLGFLHKNKKVFSTVEKKYSVPKETIASLLWVETKYGRDIGKYHVASAFLSIVQADYPPILFQLMDLAKERYPRIESSSVDKIQEKAKTKSDWAVNELLALQELHEKKYKDAAKLKGSFSGAFGLAQFLPSSYLTWAKGNKTQPNLFKAEDSIYSVANYLSQNGWKEEDESSKRAALFHYNRDLGYGNRILRMSDCLRSPAKLKKWKKAKKPTSC